MSLKSPFLDLEPNPSFDEVQDVSPEEVSKKMDQVVLIDVRTQDEYHGELGHIPNAQLMTLDSLPDKVEELPKEQTIVFICRSGQRSANATAFAKQHGFSDVYNMKGGMLLWNEKGYPTDQ